MLNKNRELRRAILREKMIVTMAQEKNKEIKKHGRWILSDF